MAGCNRGCVGTSINDATNICGVQIQQDCSPGCTGLTSGQSRIQINADGEIVICSNVGGVCECETFCETICEIVSTNDCLNGGVGDDYMLRDFNIVDGVLTVDSAPEHTSVSVQVPRANIFLAPGHPGTPLLNHDVLTLVGVLNNPSLCREMAVMVHVTGSVNPRDLPIGSFYTGRYQIDSSLAGANISRIGERIRGPADNVGVEAVEGTGLALAYTEIVPPGGSVTYTAYAQLRNAGVASAPTGTIDAALEMSIIGHTI